MPVPKAAVDKDNAAASGKYEVGIARQIAAVESVAKTEAMDHPADNHFWLRVFAPHAAHYCAALSRRESVHGVEIIIATAVAMGSRRLRWGMLQLADRPQGRGFSPRTSSEAAI